MNLQYVIYKHPSDYPDKFVVRRWLIITSMLAPDTTPIGVVDSLEEARKLIPEVYGFKMPRLPQDDVAVAEVWMKAELGEKIVMLLTQTQITQ